MVNFHIQRNSYLINFIIVAPLVSRWRGAGLSRVIFIVPRKRDEEHGGIIFAKLGIFALRCELEWLFIDVEEEKSADQRRIGKGY